MKKSQKSQPAGSQGFTLAEVLIVVSIIMLLSLVFLLMNISGQMAHATDAKRKSDLNMLSKFFEEYYNDNSAFPAQPVVNDCGGKITPYINTIPCDPVSKTHYGYFPSLNGGYRICAKLTDTTDPAIAAAGCSGAEGCGLGGPPSGGVYNYCLSSGVTASALGTPDQIFGGESTPTPTTAGPTPTPTPYVGPHNACTIGGDCDWFDNPYSSIHQCPNAWVGACPGYVAGHPFTGVCDPIWHNLCAD